MPSRSLRHSTSCQVLGGIWKLRRFMAYYQEEHDRYEAELLTASVTSPATAYAALELPPAKGTPDWVRRNAFMGAPALFEEGGVSRSEVDRILEQERIAANLVGREFFLDKEIVNDYDNNSSMFERIEELVDIDEDADSIFEEIPELRYFDWDAAKLRRFIEYSRQEARRYAVETAAVKDRDGMIIGSIGHAKDMGQSAETLMARNPHWAGMGWDAARVRNFMSSKSNAMAGRMRAMRV